MVDTARWNWPADMARQAGDHPAGVGELSGWAEEVVERVRTFAREKPEEAMLWALGIGFVLGWKLKPW